MEERIAEGLREAVERRLPGFRSLVAYRELSTPLSTEAFTGHRGGEIYGIPFTPERLDMPFLQARTPVKGLFLCGADALMLGIGGTAMSGLMAAAAVAGPSTFPALRREARRPGRPATPATAAATSPSSA